MHIGKKYNRTGYIDYSIKPKKILPNAIMPVAGITSTFANLHEPSVYGLWNEIWIISENVMPGIRNILKQQIVISWITAISCEDDVLIWI